MSSTVFKLTYTELQNKIVPQNGEYTFLIAASGGQMTIVRADEVLNVAEDQALMRLSARHRQLLREVDGEILVRSAAGGETSLQCSLFPLVAGTLKLWKNYACSKKGWKVRNTVDAMTLTTDYTVNETTGAVTLVDALAEGDSVWATYRHDAAQKFLGIRDCALSIAAAEVARQYAYFRGAEGFDRFERWEASAYQNLDKLVGLDLIDRIELVEQTERDGFYHRVLDL